MDENFDGFNDKLPELKLGFAFPPFFFIIYKKKTQFLMGFKFFHCYWWLIDSALLMGFLFA